MVIVKRSRIQRYGLAVLSVLSSLLLMLGLDSWIAMKTSPFLMFFGAVMVSAWYGGRGPGLLATFLSSPFSSYFFIPEYYSLAFNLPNSLRLFLFVLEGILISVLCGALRTANRRLEVSLLKLRVSEERYRRIIDTAYEGIWTINAQGRIEYVNQRMAQMLGYSVEEMLDRSVFEFVDEAVHSEAKRNFERCHSSVREQFDFCFRRKDRSDLWAIVSTNPIFSKTGEFQGAIAMITDVSDAYGELRLRVSAEEALRKSEQQFRMAVDNFPDAFVIYDANQRVQFINARGLKLMGKSLEEVLGHTDQEIWPSDVAERYLPLRLRAIETGTLQSEECHITLAGLGNFTMIVKYMPVLDETGEIVSLVGITYDITDRKRLEDELRHSEARFRRLVESNIIGIFFPALDGNIVDANDAFLQMLGYTREELRRGKVNWKTMTPPEYQKLDEQKVEELRTVGVCTPFEKEYIRKDGNCIPILVGAAVLEESEQKTVAFALDLSERKQAESALRQSEAKFRRLFDSNIVGIIFPDLSGNIWEANDAFLDMAGYTREDLLAGRVDWNAMTPHEYRHLDERALKQLRTSGVCSPYEKEFIRQDGSRVPIFLAAAFLEGSQHHTVCYALDLTERNLAIEALRESEERFRHMADTAPVLIWMSGSDKLCNYFNKPWLDFTGRTMEQELGNGWIQGVHPDDFQHCLDTYVKAFDARQDFTIEYRLRHFDSQYRWVLNNGIPRFTPDGSFLGYISSCIDISDRKLAEAEIQQLNQNLEQRVKERTAQLEAANKELESFSYSVSHDLRAPLRHISGFVDLLQKRVATTLDETSLRYLNTITQTTKQAGTLIDNLLAFSRMGRTQMRYTTINMNQLVPEVQRDIELETTGRTICWHIEQLPSVQGDPSLLRLVLSNLMENAVKYTQTRVQAEIEIGCTENEDEVVFFIRDNGVGFDMRYVHKLFGVFQRLHSAEQFEGTGIGLANVQRIIHRHRGRTWAEGIVDGGATFYFSLPNQRSTTHGYFVEP